MANLVTDAFAAQALAFPSRVDRALEKITKLEDAKGMLDKAVAMQKYAEQLKAGIEIGKPIAVGVLKIKIKLGQMMPRENGGRGKKTPKAALGFSAPTVSAYRKMADKADRLDAYCDATDDVPSQGEFLRWCDKPHVSNNSGEVEWYTPPEIIEAARSVLGEIDLDPCSSPVAQRYIKATTFYTPKRDGLKENWSGRVWMNPPYATGVMVLFITKLVESIQHGDVSSACVLVNNATDTSWFHELTSITSAACFLAGRLRFLDTSGQPSKTPLQGQVIVYTGRRLKTFRNTFAPFGWCVEPTK